MAENNIEYSRLIMKRSQLSGTTPTIPTGDTIDNTWVDTDILTGELFYNIPDKKLWTRSGEEIILLSEGTSGTTMIETLEQTLISGNNSGSNWIEFPKPYGIKSDSVLYDDKIQFNAGSIRIQSDDLTTYSSYIDVAPTKIDMYGDNEINIYGGATFSGITYDVDYSANYTNRSLVDKEYVDTNIDTYTLFEVGSGTTSTQRKGATNIASGDHSFAIGRQNTASGARSVSSGYLSTSTGNQSFAHGYLCDATNQYTIAMGRENTASGIGSMTFGYLNDVNTGSYSVAIGQTNTIYSSYSTAFGYNNTVNGTYGVAGGFGSTVSVGTSAVALGYLNQSTGNQSASFNNTNLAAGTNSFVINQLNTASGFNSYAGGFTSKANNTGAYAHGYYNNASGNYSTALGGYGLTGSSQYCALLGGQLNTVSGNHSAVIGGAENVVTGARSVTIGGSGMDTNSEDDTVMVPDLNVQGTLYVNKQMGTKVTTGVTTTNSFTYDCNQGMTQVLDLQGSTGTATISLSNPLDGSTYTLYVIQGSGLYDVSFGTGKYWINDAAFDFTTLADNDVALVTMQYVAMIGWTLSAKKLTLV